MDDSHVVSNTSPVNYLILIDEIDLLPHLFGTIEVPDAVREELTHPDSPEKVRSWIRESPDWFSVVSAPEPNAENAGSLGRFHPGERDAILLAERIEADLLLLDEKVGRSLAKARDLSVTGLLGVLDEAATQGIVDLPDAVDRLRQTRFRISADLLRWVLDRHD